MKKRFISFGFILALGSLLMLTSCTTNSEQKIPSNRTRENYELEKEFDPLLTFLDEKEKDFSGMERYSATFRVRNPESDNIEDIITEYNITGIESEDLYFTKEANSFDCSTSIYTPDYTYIFVSVIDFSE